MAVSKSVFQRGLVCLRRAYFDVHQRDWAEPPSRGDVERMKAGQQVGKLARSLFDGVLIEAQSFDMERAAAETQEAIASGAQAIFEATFLSSLGEVRCDVLQRNGETWNLVEVKSSKEAKPEHLTDLAFQRAVLESCGLKVAQCSLVLISSEYVSDEVDVDALRFFRFENVTSEVEVLLPFVREQAEMQNSMLESEAAPDVVPSVHCVRNGGCGYQRVCFRDLPVHDVTTLPMVRHEAVIELHIQGIRDIAAIPPTTKLSERQRLIVGVVQSGEPYVSPELGPVLEAINYPVHFVDFEALASAIPAFPGVAPYEAVPFQWSDHVLDVSGANTHMEFLGGQDDPREAFASTLWEAVKDAGTVVHYATYEKTILKLLVRSGVPHAAELLEVFESRGLDLERVVRDRVYFAEFRGRTSIKRVFPALVPNSGYSDLEVQDGDHAAAEYKRMLSVATTKEEKQRIARTLLDYCERDTLAMLEVFQALRRIAKEHH